MNRFSNTRERIKLAKDGDERELELLVLENTPLVKSIAKRFVDRGVDFEDLVQIGTIGLIRAIRGFNFDFDTALSTYAVPMIAGEIKRFLRDDGLLKISREVKRNASAILKFSNEFEMKHAHSPTTEEISNALQLSFEDIVFALESCAQVSALEWEGEDGERMESILGVDTMERDFDRIAINSALEHLSENERLLIKLRYFKNLTQQQTADVLGLTQVKVSRDEKKICAKLRLLLE